MAVTSKVLPTTVRATETTTRPPGKYRQAFPQYVAVAPFFIPFAIFGAFPVLFSIPISFHSWDGIGQMKWVGLEQYNYLLSDPTFWKTIGNTLIIWVLSTVPMLLLALVIANALHNAHPVLAASTGSPTSSRTSPRWSRSPWCSARSSATTSAC